MEKSTTRVHKTWVPPLTILLPSLPPGPNKMKKEILMKITDWGWKTRWQKRAKGNWVDTVGRGGRKRGFYWNPLGRSDFQIKKQRESNARQREDVTVHPFSFSSRSFIHQLRTDVPEKCRFSLRRFNKIQHSLINAWVIVVKRKYKVSSLMDVVPWRFEQVETMRSSPRRRRNEETRVAVYGVYMFTMDSFSRIETAQAVK